jgi:Asp/Glu/hydantoin racemase
MRELLNIPVLGLCECSVHVACLMSATFSLINVNPKFTHRIVESIKLQGLASRLVSVEQMKLDRPGVFDLALRNDAAKAEIRRPVRRLRAAQYRKRRGSAGSSRRQPDGAFG